MKQEYSGEAYITAIVDFVNRLNNHSINVILDLHWTAPGTEQVKVEISSKVITLQATKQVPMPDMDHSVDFWVGVANTFKNNTAVIFDLFNEPFPDYGFWNSTIGWNCWRVCANYNSTSNTQILFL